MLIWTALFALTLTKECLAAAGPNIPTQELDPQFWNRMAKSQINARLKMSHNYNTAKNVIFFIGDGLGPTTVTAARILKGQLAGQPGEETVLAFERFPNVALSKTYNVDRQTPDSAGTASAMLSGVKTNYYLIGLNARASRADCEGSKGKEMDTILDWAVRAGKRTGIVTTARITHATPAAAYAHAADRYWEGDVNTKGITSCRDIAQQLVDDNADINVLFGGGRRHFLPNTTADPETNTIDKNHRQDGRNLIEDWTKYQTSRGRRSAYVWNLDQFNAVNPTDTDYMLGLFEPNHMQYELERNTSREPSIAMMTQKAIEVLRKGDNGYFLLVEGARIDHAHHDSLAKKALHETISFEAAISQAVAMTNQEDTLIVVTGDHSHAFDIQGYSYRGLDILGLADPLEEDEPTLDQKPYTILQYGNGPGYETPRKNLTGVDTHGNNYIFPSGVPVEWETHGGEDVAIYAQGPMAHLFYGVQEQNYIAHVMAYSACIGPYTTSCDHGQPIECTSGCEHVSLHIYAFIALLFVSLV